MADEAPTMEVEEQKKPEPTADADVDGIVTLTYVKEKTSIELPLHAKLAHLLAVVVSGVIALFVSAVLADGRSVVILKDTKDLPRLTDPALIDKGLDYRADELLGPGYGVGLHHDASGQTWTESGAHWTLAQYVEELGLLQVIAAVPSVIATDGLKHPVHFLSCHELKSAGLSAMSLGYIAEVVAALMIIFHGVALVGLFNKTGLSAMVGKALASLVWLVLVLGFLIVIGLALAVMNVEWKCTNPFIPTITLSQHFDWNYGLGFGYAGYISALLVFMTLVCFTSTKDGVEAEAGPTKKTFCKWFGGVGAGLLLLMVVSLAIAGGEGAFDDDDGFADRNGDFNYCAGQKPYSAGPGDKYFKDVACMKDGVVQVLEQAGANITKGYKGGLDAGTWRQPIDKPYKETDLCPVNVHWHLGAEHLSIGQFDDKGKGPKDGGSSHKGDEYSRRELAGSDTRLGFRCHYYDEEDKRYDDSRYEWKYCTGMMVGETYEIHWPHSAAGACGTKWQYQSPFYDGVFCNDGIINILTPLNTYENIGVQGQVFTIINDESYYNGDLFHGAIVSHVYGHGQDIAMYTGSTTGTARNNEICSRYAPITWQVDRKCHLISASSFDEMCRIMLEQADDMSGDIYPHGAREVVDTRFVANNQQSRRGYRE